MLSWISEQINTLSPPRDLGPHADLKRAMREAIAFDAVLSSAKDLEYKFVLEQICRSSFEVEERMIILDFLHYTMAPVDPNSEWRTVFNGLRILNTLIDSGSIAVFTEVAEGKHFDLVQKTLFLTTYANSDERIGKLIRTAAKEIRDKLLLKFDAINSGTLVDESPSQEVKAISSSSVSSTSTPASRPVAPSGVAHIVALRHVEDSSEDEAITAAHPVVSRPVAVVTSGNPNDSLLDFHSVDSSNGGSSPPIDTLIDTSAASVMPILNTDLISVTTDTPAADASPPKATEQLIDLL